MWYQHVVLRPGAHGPAVAAARRRLHRLGYDVTEASQQFDEDLSAAVVAFQVHRQLTPDGVIGASTWRCLFDEGEERTENALDDETVSRPWAHSPVGGHYRTRAGAAHPDRSPWAPPKHLSDAERATVLHVSVADRRLSLHTADGSVHRFPAAVGSELAPTTPGRYTVRDLIREPGPPLGTRWIRLHPECCDIHGTDEPWTVGQAVTPGCIRLYNKDVEFVFHRLVRGTPLIIE